jgi:hypothetical protein
MHPPRGRPKKVTPEIRDFIDVRTLQSARLSITDMSSEVRCQIGTFKKLNAKDIFCADRRIVTKRSEN